jgi:hypothetical protein
MDTEKESRCELSSTYSIPPRSAKLILIYIRRVTNLPVVLYGCETLTLKVKEEHRLKVFENMVLRKIFGPKWDEVVGGRGRFHNEELHNLYCSPSIIRIIKSRRMRWAGHVARMGRRGMHIGFWWESQKERDH